MFSFLLGTVLGGEFLGYNNNAVFDFLRNCKNVFLGYVGMRFLYLSTITLSSA